MSVSTESPDRAPEDTAAPVGGDPIAVIRRHPHPPMVGDDRWDRRMSRKLSALRSARSTR